jgi:hypothetical protein
MAAVHSTPAQRLIEEFDDILELNSLSFYCDIDILRH